MKRYHVVWSPRATTSLREVYDFINKNSPQGAKRVASELAKLALSLETMPNRFPVEPLLKDESVEFRFAVKWNYKLIYVVEEDAARVVIVQIFNTRRDPSNMTI